MTAEAHLPDHSPITSEDEAADLVSLCLSLDDITNGAILMFICDADRRPRVPVVISEIPVVTPPGQILEHWFEHLGAHFPDGELSLVFARARSGHPFIIDLDRAWHEGVVAACTEHAIDLIASFTVTQHAVIPFPAPVSLGTSPDASLA